MKSATRTKLNQSQNRYAEELAALVLIHKGSSNQALSLAQKLQVTLNVLNGDRDG